MIHTVHTRGYGNCPQFTSIEEAGEYLQLLVAESLAKARRRGHRQATKQRHSDTNYSITLGPDKRSTLYAQHFIVSS